MRDDDLRRLLRTAADEGLFDGLSFDARLREAVRGRLAGGEAAAQAGGGEPTAGPGSGPGPAGPPARPAWVGWAVLGAAAVLALVVSADLAHRAAGPGAGVPAAGSGEAVPSQRGTAARSRAAPAQEGAEAAPPLAVRAQREGDGVRLALRIGGAAGERLARLSVVAVLAGGGERRARLDGCAPEAGTWRCQARLADVPQGVSRLTVRLVEADGAGGERTVADASSVAVLP